MTPQDFCYWLKGFDELHQTPPSPEQWQSIREHLSLVFTKVTPPVLIPDQNKPFCDHLLLVTVPEVNNPNVFDNQLFEKPISIC